MGKQATPRWNAVSIVSASGSCEAARALKGRRFLSAEAPRLPLAECAYAASCRCVYRKYADRREGPRREDDETGVRRSGAVEQERRRRGGRRSTDK
jgi:hypothetical protein